MLVACREEDRPLPALPTPPNKAKDVQKWIDATVEVRLRETVRRDVTRELLMVWERETALAARTAIPEVTARLVDVFEDLLDAFDELADAPAPCPATKLRKSSNGTPPSCALQASCPTRFWSAP